MITMIKLAQKDRQLYFAYIAFISGYITPLPLPPLPHLTTNSATK